MKVESQTREIATLKSQQSEREDTLHCLQQHHKKLLRDNDRLKGLLEDSERGARNISNIPLSDTNRYSEKAKLEQSLRDMQTRMASLTQENDRLCALLRRNQISHPDPLASMKYSIYN